MAIKKDEKNYLNKLSHGAMGLDPRIVEKLVVDGKKSVPAARIYGQVTGMKADVSDNGPYVKFFGIFEGINLLDRKVHRAKILCLPGTAEAFVADAYGSAAEADPKASIQFGLDLIANPHTSTKGGWKFKYSVTPLSGGATGKDALSLMGEKLGELPPMITQK